MTFFIQRLPAVRTFLVYLDGGRFTMCNIMAFINTKADCTGIHVIIHFQRLLTVKFLCDSCSVWISEWTERDTFTSYLTLCWTTRKDVNKFGSVFLAFLRPLRKLDDVANCDSMMWHVIDNTTTEVKLIFSNKDFDIINTKKILWFSKTAHKHYVLIK